MNYSMITWCDPIFTNALVDALENVFVEDCLQR
jgi:hypothetical protein